MRKSYYFMHRLLRYAKNVLRYAVIITLCGNYYVMWNHTRRRRRSRRSLTSSRHEVRSFPFVARPRGQRVACWIPRGEQASTPARMIGPVVVAPGLTVYGRSDTSKFRRCRCRSGQHIPDESTFGRDGIGPRCPCCCCFRSS